MNDIPHVSIDQPHVWSEKDRDLIACHLEELARQVRAGLFGDLHPGATNMRKLGQPIPNVDVMMVFTRPGPLP